MKYEKNIVSALHVLLQKYLGYCWESVVGESCNASTSILSEAMEEAVIKGKQERLLLMLVSFFQLFGGDFHFTEEKREHGGSIPHRETILYPAYLYYQNPLVTCYDI